MGYLNKLKILLHLGDGQTAPADINIPSDIDEEAIGIIKLVQPFTMTSPERIYALINSVRYVIRHNIPGAIVECGVWKGGSMMAAAKVIADKGGCSKELYLFDTFNGMPEPTIFDNKKGGGSAMKKFKETYNQHNSGSNWCYADIEEVKKNIYSTGYDKDKVFFIKGKVEDTIPDKAPDSISLLRLDTDWYESTKHELLYLFPRLAEGGVIIIDDYGTWEGARKAVEEYLEFNNTKIVLQRIDSTARIGVKLSK